MQWAALTWLKSLELLCQISERRRKSQIKMKTLTYAGHKSVIVYLLDRCYALNKYTNIFVCS